MRIHFRVDGGFAVFPGLSRPSCIDLDTLPADEAGRWRSLVERSRFFERPALPAAAPCADGRSYAITVEADGRSRTLTLPDTIDDPDLCALIRSLNERQRTMRSTNRD